jgi:Kef-type K+ transport system membrane component KefB
MRDVAFDLLILLAGIWLVAVTLRPLGLPTVMGELIVGVSFGLAILFGLGWVAATFVGLTMTATAVVITL